MLAANLNHFPLDIETPNALPPFAASDSSSPALTAFKGKCAEARVHYLDRPQYLQPSYDQMLEASETFEMDDLMANTVPTLLQQLGTSTTQVYWYYILLQYCFTKYFPAVALCLTTK